MQDFGLGAHQRRIAGGQRVDDRVRRRPPGLVEVDERAVLVEENAEHGHGGLSHRSHHQFARLGIGRNRPRFIL